MDSVCKQNLLEVVARGCTIVTELQRLVELIPEPFKCDRASKDSPLYLDSNKTHTIYDIISDFSYFNDVEAFERRVEASETLKRADQNLSDAYLHTLTRFYLTFESVQRYASDLNSFSLEMEQDLLLGHSIESLIANNESCQLICEAYFLLGYMLIFTDNNFHGGFRERIIVSYYRYSSHRSSPNSCLDLTCNLMRKTGFCSPQQQASRIKNVQPYRPDGYPESFLSRVSVSDSLINLLIAKLQSVDIYSQTNLGFVHTDHRSAALAHQASMIYVLLYFCPDILKTQRSRMREITDKFFYDHWTVSLHMGDLVNIIEAWYPYKAARESLMQLFEAEYVNNLVVQNNMKFEKVSRKIDQFLQEGWLDEETILENYTQIFSEIRSANFLLRWMLLQSQINSGWQPDLSISISQITAGRIPGKGILCDFFQSLAKLEAQFASMLAKIMDEKSRIISESKTKASDILTELIEIFSAIKPARWIQSGSNSNLIDMLDKARSSLSQFDSEKPQMSEFIIRIIRDLESSKETHFDGQSLQVVQLFASVKTSLMRILRSLNLTSESRVALQSVSDMSYAWKIMEDFTVHMRRRIWEDPGVVKSIEPSFHKLASAFEPHLHRIRQANAEKDLISVSRYYSSKMISFCREVLFIVPSVISECISEISEIQRTRIPDNVSKISTENLKHLATSEERSKILKLTLKISHYAESMLKMRETTVGLIRVDSRRMLEDGMRRELVNKISSIMREKLVEVPSQRATNNNSDLVRAKKEISERLDQLQEALNMYKRSFEYVQDYLNIHSLWIWQGELSRVINLDLDQATRALTGDCNFLKKESPSQSVDQQCIYQPMKLMTSSANPDYLDSSIVYQLFDVILKLSDPRATIFDEQMSSWHEQRSLTKTTMDLQVFETILAGLGACGLNAIDSLCCTMLRLEIKSLDSFVSSSLDLSSLRIQDGRTQPNGLVEVLMSLIRIQRDQQSSRDSNIKLASKQISLALAKTLASSERLISHLLRIGQLECIRKCIKFNLSSKSMHEARNIYSCLDALNGSLLAAIKANKISETSVRKSNQQKSRRNSEDSNGNGESISDGNSTWACRLGSSQSQIMCELTNHLDFIGLSDPESKLYTLGLSFVTCSDELDVRESLAVELIALILLDQSSKFHFSRSINGFLPRKSKTFYESSHTVDGQTLLIGLRTFMSHWQPFLGNPSKKKNCNAQVGLRCLLKTLSFYARCLLDIPGDQSKSLQDLPLELANTILIMSELIRLSRDSPEFLLADSYLPKFIIDSHLLTRDRMND